MINCQEQMHIRYPKFYDIFDRKILQQFGPEVLNNVPNQYTMKGK